MKNHNETIPDILAEFSQEQAIERREILKYTNRLSLAWKREKDAARSRLYRLNKKSNVTQSVTESVTQSVTESVTLNKEERSEKENLPPTPPIKRKREERRNKKGKKEETLTNVSVPRSRAHAHTQGMPRSPERRWRDELS